MYSETRHGLASSTSLRLLCAVATLVAEGWIGTRGYSGLCVLVSSHPRSRDCGAFLGSDSVAI